MRAGSGPDGKINILGFAFRSDRRRGERFFYLGALHKMRAFLFHKENRNRR